MEIYRAVDVKPSTKKHKVLLGDKILAKGDIVIMVGWPADADDESVDGDYLVRLADATLHHPNQIILGDCEEEEFRPIELHAKPLPLFVKKTPGGPVDEADKGKEVPSAFQNQSIEQVLHTYKNVCEQQGLEIRRLNGSCDKLSDVLAEKSQQVSDLGSRIVELEITVKRLLDGKRP